MPRAKKVKRTTNPDAITINGRVSLEQKEMIAELVRRGFYFTQSEVLRRGIVLVYQEHIKDYIEVQRNRNNVKKEAIKHDLNIGNKRSVKRLEAELEELGTDEKLVGICESLNGKIIEENGKKLCQYKAYELASPGYAIESELTVSFKDLSEENVKNQYVGGTREEVEEALKPKK